MPRFNYIYQELVTKPDDLVGLLAYSIYKHEKIDYIRDFGAEHGRAPEPEELKDFHRMSMARCNQYRQIAVQLMGSFQQATFEKTVEELDVRYEQELKARIAKLKPSLWTGVWQSLAGTLLYTVMLGGIVCLVLGVRYGLSGLLQEGFSMFTGK